RNALRDRPVPAPTLADQIRRVSRVRDDLDAEGWDAAEVVAVVSEVTRLVQTRNLERSTSAVWDQSASPTASHGLRVVLQLSRFPWGEDPGAWVGGMARGA